MSIICAIHQPNFFPWLGYFDKIKKADVFVFLDDVQNSKTGSSWVNRTKLNCFGKEKWYTCSIKRPHGVIPVNSVEFSDLGWKINFIEVLRNYYRKYTKCDEVSDIILRLIDEKEYCYLSNLNKDIITYFSKYFGCSTKFLSKSDLGIKSKSTYMLIDICKAVGADAYLCGGGASGYQEDDAFSDANIQLIYQNFELQPYGIQENFIPGLSIIDYLMSV
jgi:hypothetical protein